MTNAARQTVTQEIVLDEVFPNKPGAIWKALTSGDLIARWLMAPTGFALIVGNRFTFQTTAAGAWDGTIHCEILEIVPEQRLVYSWQGGHAGNVGYGSLLDTTVSWTLSQLATGTRVRMTHSGFIMPTNSTAFQNMSNGWKKVVERLGPVADEQIPEPASSAIN